MWVRWPKEKKKYDSAELPQYWFLVKVWLIKIWDEDIAECESKQWTSSSCFWEELKLTPSVRSIESRGEDAWNAQNFTPVIGVCDQTFAGRHPHLVCSLSARRLWSSILRRAVRDSISTNHTFRNVLVLRSIQDSFDSDLREFFILTLTLYSCPVCKQ